MQELVIFCSMLNLSSIGRKELSCQIKFRKPLPVKTPCLVEFLRKNFWLENQLYTYICFLVCDGCNETFRADNGGFHSPNYPQQYPDDQYCSWRITVSPSHQVYLIFTSFTLQAENNTDAVYVYDGDSETGEVLGVFYGGNPPPKGIYSSSNSLLVIFKSDNKSSYTGFQAVYHYLNCSGKLTYAVFFAEMFYKKFKYLLHLV